GTGKVLTNEATTKVEERRSAAVEGAKMATDVKVPAAGESITEVYIGTWLKKPGEAVAVDEPIVEVETDKATLDVPAPVAGVLMEQLKGEGEAATIGEVIARIDETASVPAAAPAAEPAPEPAPAATPAAPVPATAPPGAKATSGLPAAQRLLEENGLTADEVPATGPGGRLLKEDVQNYLAHRERQAATQAGGARVALPAEERQEEVVPMSLLRRR